MPHIPFYSVLPIIAENETRTIFVQEKNSVLPMGEYGFVELFCDDTDCDCRNVYIHVMGQDSPELLATICYGWESLKFYKDWMGAARIDEMVKDFKGPSLALGKQSDYANTLLEIYKNLLKDKPNHT